MWAQRPELQKMLVFGNTLAILMMGYFSYIQHQENQEMKNTLNILLWENDEEVYMKKPKFKYLTNSSDDFLSGFANFYKF